MKKKDEALTAPLIEDRQAFGGYAMKNGDAIESHFFPIRIIVDSPLVGWLF